MIKNNDTKLTMPKFEKYQQSVRFLESLSNLPILDYMRSQRRSSFYLKRTATLVRKLNINLTQFKFIHIAGTSGKGSTVSMVHQSLLAAGKKVGSFYSPHPTTSVERIKVGKKYIQYNAFAKLLDKIKPIMDQVALDDRLGGAPSYFEIFFAIALLYFEEKKCEYVILEVGCGGAFDATNIIPRPLVTAITNIGLDHTEILGATLAAIAKTKSGIIKSGSVFMTTEKRLAITSIFKKICSQRQAVFVSLPIKTTDTHAANSLLAAEISRYLGIDKKHIKIGIKNSPLPCRFEIMQKNPTVVLDGAHNSDKMKSTVGKLKKLNFGRLFLIITLNKNKDARKIITYLNKQLPRQTNVYITRHLIAERTCQNTKLMYNLFKNSKNIKKRIYIDPWQALNSAIKEATKDDLILVTGSFFLAGELRKKWITEKKILQLC
ncbi:hypothetical protein COT27_03125 [Candidatus Kuenenbacteria bacterium CG08_land_8_20_14_0_20_37_23]|uniref:tetrahydrofolate synthase n=2 Tax=Candidatus Kueneniibacteriota TaxID=1752740 RepID=A0A2M6XS28_9BACT|nr:MAG: hypothetical protein AUJ29_00835 [Candidatus Kuenenbacteria bacterium CG1_02_38_13]PIU10433.1 MAG: hypothetical protein COT27_03125 [Candidatus Kuenenbacteria bacterium CG08_land_8_20_14_0_20_37_23]